MSRIALTESYKIMGSLSVKVLHSLLQVNVQILRGVIILHVKRNIKVNSVKRVDYLLKTVKVNAHKIVYRKPGQHLYLLNAKLLRLFQVALCNLLRADTDCRIDLLIMLSDKHARVARYGQDIDLARPAVKAGKHNRVAAHTALVHAEQKYVHDSDLNVLTILTVKRIKRDFLAKVGPRNRLCRNNAADRCAYYTKNTNER